ncbi:MAG: VWA domain-containing protein [Muribaculaceae bacterium]|nr:VWA domain-containing protein [Muribaculaceae bacterium]
MGLFRKKKKTVTVEETVTMTSSTKTSEVKNEEGFAQVAPKNIGKLDMVIAFDTTGSMAQYIGAVRKEVSELIPQLFKDNEDLRLGIVAFGDYCDMNNAQDFGDAYQCINPTDNENDLIKFVRNSRDTSGGDWPEFYELVIKKIVEETQWREGSTRSILLIADAVPHEVGYSYRDIINGSQIDWRIEARKAAYNKIKIDTVTITDAPWFKELSLMTNGVSVPFHTGYKTAELLRASVMSRGSMKARRNFDVLMDACDDDEMKEVYASYKKERDNFDF